MSMLAKTYPLQREVIEGCQGQKLMRGENNEAYFSLMVATLWGACSNSDDYKTIATQGEESSGITD